MIKIPFKLKIFIFTLMILAMVVYNFVFGTQNAVLGLMVVLAALMNLGNDLSFKPKLSFVKISLLFLILAVVSFLNNPITVWGCVLTFVVVFATTFTSYSLFGNNSYLAYLMIYFMMMCIPVTAEELPLRIVSLIFGAAFIVGLNVAVNKKKDYKLSKQTIDNLVCEINNAIDSRLEGREVPIDSFKTANGFYSSLFSKFEYKFLPSRRHELVLNIVKAFQYIGSVIAECNLSEAELNHIKNVLSKMPDIDRNDIFQGVEIRTMEMHLVLLNLEIILNEIKNKNQAEKSYDLDKTLIFNSIGSVVKKMFSFRSARFTFAFKMAFVLALWEILTLAFNLPYTKWLYFATMPMMVPYIDDASFTAKSRVKGTFVGVFIFTLVFIMIPYIPLSSKTIIMIIFVACMLGMVLNLENKFRLTAFTTVISVMAALMYIKPPDAVELKILWVTVAAVIVSTFNFAFLPYSVEKETENNLELGFKLNQKSLDLVKNGESFRKNTLLVVSNIIHENIEITDENRNVYRLQTQITDMCNFILSYSEVYAFSDDLKSDIVGIIEDNRDISADLSDNEKIIAYSVKYVNDLLEMENKYFNG